MGIYREEFGRAFSNKRFLIVALLAALSFAYGVSRVFQVNEAGQLGALAFWGEALWRGSYGFFAALMAGLPFAASLLSDRKDHFINQVLVRCAFKEYVRAKILANLCAGAAAVAVPVLLFLAGCCLALPLDPSQVPDVPTGVSDVLTPGVIPPGGFISPSPAGYIALAAAMAALFGAAYASLGLGVSLLVRNPFVALGFPFVCYSLGCYIIPASAHLRWLGSPEAALLPGNSLLPALLQYLGLFTAFLLCLLAFGRKDRLLSD